MGYMRKKDEANGEDTLQMLRLGFTFLLFYLRTSFL